jgi:hypothetical protein
MRPEPVIHPGDGICLSAIREQVLLAQRENFSILLSYFLIML